MKFRNQVALITGGSRGIGRAIALKLSEQGADIVIFYKSSHQDAVNLEKKIKENNRKCMIEVVDVSEFKNVEEGIKKIIRKFNRIDILINNAGITRDSLFINMSQNDWERVINVNLNGVYNCIKHVLPYMLEKGRGSIINISSLSAYISNIGQANYSASKAGVIGLTKTLAKEVARKGIRVNAVVPGCINTDMFNQIPEEIWEDIVEKIPLAYLGEGEDVANAVSFLASDESGYIIGEVIKVDGGFSLGGI